MITKKLVDCIVITSYPCCTLKQGTTHHVHPPARPDLRTAQATPASRMGLHMDTRRTARQREGLQMSKPIPIKDWTAADHEAMRLAIAEHDAETGADDDDRQHEDDECGQFFDGR